jgi:hypothetical protein
MSITIHGKYDRNFEQHWDTRGRTGAITNGGYRVFSKGKRDATVRKYEHRMIMEQYLGRELLPTEHIHHINGDKLDNRIENLELTNKLEHTRQHAISIGLGKSIRPTRIGNQHGGQFSENEILKIRELRQSGVNVYQIAKDLRHSPTSIYKYL